MKMKWQDRVLLKQYFHLSRMYFHSGIFMERKRAVLLRSRLQLLKFLNLRCSKKGINPLNVFFIYYAFIK